MGFSLPKQFKAHNRSYTIVINFGVVLKGKTPIKHYYFPYLDIMEKEVLIRVVISYEI